MSAESQKPGCIRQNNSWIHVICERVDVRVVEPEA